MNPATWGFQLLLAIASAVYPPRGTREVTESPQHTFRIESYYGSEGALPNATWIIPRDKKAGKVALPDPPHPSKLFSYQFSVSPDEQWIVLEQKQGSGVNAVWLYERTAPFHYAEVKPSSFSEQAWRFLGKQTHRKFHTNDFISIIRVSDWPKAGSHVRKIALCGGDEKTVVPTANDHALLISLLGDDDKTSVDLWFCYYDLEKRCFYLDAALQKYNKGRVTPSRHQGRPSLMLRV